jgi:hypothetical protein
MRVEISGILSAGDHIIVVKMMMEIHICGAGVLS